MVKNQHKSFSTLDQMDIITSSSQTWRAALSWAAVPSVVDGARPGAFGDTQNVGASAVGGAMLE
jgi:hypothetical protein